MVQTSQLHLRIFRHARFVWMRLYHPLNLGQNLYFLPFSLELYRSWLGYKLQTLEKLFFSRVPHPSWNFTGLIRREKYGLQFQVVIECLPDLELARAFAIQLEKNLGASWRVQSLEYMCGEERHQIALETV